MKLRTLALLSLAAFALFCASSASVASPFSANDLILCFDSTGGTGASTDLEIDLGNFQTLNLVPSGSLSLNTILTNTYGSSWASDGDVGWAVVGANNTNQGVPGSTVYLTDNTFTSLSSQPISQQHSTALAIFDIYGAGSGTAVSGFTGVTIPNSATDSFTVNYDSSGSTGDGIADEEGAGFIEQTLTGSNETTGLFDIVPETNQSTGGSDTQINTFTLDTNGTFLASEYGSVPEPSTWGTVCLGALTLAVLRFRRRSV